MPDSTRQPMEYHWNAERKQYFASSAALPGFSAAADTVEELNAQLRAAVSEWAAEVRERGALVPGSAADEVEYELIAAEGPLVFGDALPELDDDERVAPIGDYPGTD